MKNITLLLVALLMQGFCAVAQIQPTGNLTIFSEDGSPFYLVLNGQRYNGKAQTNVRIELLPNPYYDCKVIFANTKIPSLSKTITMDDVDDIMQDVTYRIKRDRRGRRVLRFYSAIPASQNMVRPDNCAVYHYGAPNDMYIGPDGTQYHQEVVVQQTTSTNGYGMNVNMPGFGMNVSVPGDGVTTTTTTTTTTTGGGYSQNGNYNNNGGYNNGNSNGGYNNNSSNGGYSNNNSNGGYSNNGQNNNGGYSNNNNGGYNNNNGGYNNGNNNGGYNNGNNNNNGGYNNGNNNNANASNNNGTTGSCRAAMSSTDFDDALSTIKNSSFDDTRLSTAKLVLATNCVSTNQVLTLIKTLTFEQNKIELAKYAYGYCVERNNYFKVVNAFTFDSSKTELNDYIKAQK